MNLRINYWAVILLTLLHQVIGALWYTAFEARWLHAIGTKPEDLAPGPMPFVVSVIASFSLSLLMAAIFRGLKVNSAARGASYGFFIWLAFVCLPYATHQLFIGFGPALIAIDMGKDFVGFVLTGLVLGTWIKYE